MRKWITLLMTLLVGSSVSYANANTGQVSFEAGYRRDNVDWRARFPSECPFFKENTKFKDLDIFQIGLCGRTTLGCNVYLRANAYWGWILDGDFEHRFTTINFFNSDSYNGSFDVGAHNNRHNVIDDKYVYGASAALGYPFYFCDCTMILAPVVGYAVDDQTFSLDDQGIDIESEYDCFFPVSGSHCCDHKWTNRWVGPFVGVDFDYRPYGECWDFFAEVEYHWGSFHGKRHVVDEISQFGFGKHKFHSHEARGWLFAVGADYDLCNCWTVGLCFKFQDWSANRHHRHHECFQGRNHHHHDDYCSDDESSSSSSESVSGRHRNNFKWHSFAVNITVGKEF